MNALTFPIAVPPLAILDGFAETLTEVITEVERAGQSAGPFKLIARLTALIIQYRGVEDAARFVAKINGLDVVDDPQYYPAGVGRVVVFRNVTSEMFTARCDCGWAESREYDSPSPLGDFYDVREEVQQLAAEHAEIHVSLTAETRLATKGSA